MNSFSAQRSLRPINRLFGAFCFCMLSIFAGLTASAQSQSDLFRGTWLLQTPAKEGLTLLIKANGRASYFWATNTDRTVYQGIWTLDGEQAIVTWEDQSSHRIEREALGFIFTYTNPNTNESYAARAEQIPKDILGQWAKPPTIADELRSERDQAKGFFGIWSTGDGQYIFVEDDRSAASNIGPHSEGLRGAWARQGSELHIVWDSGDYSILRENDRGYAYKQIAPGGLIEEDTTKFRSAARTVADNVPADWLSTYQAEREAYAGGIAFASRKSAREFYRGSWIIHRGEKTFEGINIERFGGLESTRKKELSGSWRMDGQDIFMRWDDGLRSILNPLGHGFILYEYAAGRPLDGVPTRIFPAAPTNAAKLEKHLQDRKIVANRVIELAETAGVDLKAEDNSWGSTFARWAWPFGDETTEMNLQALEATDQPSSQDPWWWLFWSESSTNEPSNVEPAVATDESIDSAAKQPAQAPAPAKKEWYWPF